MAGSGAKNEPVSAQLSLAGSQPVAGGAPIAPFLIGTAVGGVIGAIAGTLLANVTRRLLYWAVHSAGRRLSEADRERLRFELLLQ